MIFDFTNIYKPFYLKQKNSANKGYNHPTMRQKVLLIIDLRYLSILFYFKILIYFQFTGSNILKILFPKGNYKLPTTNCRLLPVFCITSYYFLPTTDSLFQILTSYFSLLLLPTTYYQLLTSSNYQLFPHLLFPVTYNSIFSSFPLEAV